MEYSSKGLGRRSALNIGWRRDEVELSIDEARTALEALPPSLLARLELPEGEKVILTGKTRPPIVWRYVTILGEQDFRDILRVAMSKEVVIFLTSFPGRKRLFLELAGLMTLFLGRYLGVWMLEKVRERLRGVRTGGLRSGWGR